MRSSYWTSFEEENGTALDIICCEEVIALSDSGQCIVVIQCITTFELCGIQRVQCNIDYAQALKWNLYFMHCLRLMCTTRTSQVGMAYKQLKFLLLFAALFCISESAIHVCLISLLYPSTVWRN